MKDVRIRSSNRSTPVPRGCRAYCFYYCLGEVFKVIISDSLDRALQYFKLWAEEQGIDLTSGWRLTPFVDDFDVVLADDLLPRK